MTDQDQDLYEQWLSQKRNTLPEIDVRDKVLAEIASDTVARPPRTNGTTHVLAHLITVGKTIAIAASLLVGFCRVFLLLFSFSTLQ